MIQGTLPRSQPVERYIYIDRDDNWGCYVLVKLTDTIQVLAYGPSLEAAESTVREQLKGFRTLAAELSI